MNTQAIKKSFHEGRPILLLDPDRENEVDFVFPNETIQNSTLLLMLQHGKGLLCTALDEKHLLQNGFFKLPANNTDPFFTNFFVPVDHRSVHTGISTPERVCTLQALAKNNPISHFVYPGHVSLLGGKELSNRKGHTEASIELCELTGFSRAATIIEILDPQGNTHNIQYAKSIAKKHKLPFCSIQEVYTAMIQKKPFIKINFRSFSSYRIWKFPTL